MSKYFIDTEFREDFTSPWFGRPRHFIELISIGIVAEDGREYYAISNEFDIDACWNKYEVKEDFGKPQGLGDKEYWLRDNVLWPLVHDTVTRFSHGDQRNQVLDAIEGKGQLGALKTVVNKYGKSNKQIVQEIVNFIDQRYLDDKNPSRGFIYPGNTSTKSVATTDLQFYGYYCVAPDTKILTSDLRWKKASDLIIGENVMGFDENRLPGVGRSSKWRRWRNAIVTGNTRIIRPCYQLKFNDGTTVICSEDHRWLSFNQKATQWITTKSLVCNNSYKSKIVKPIDVWDEQHDWSAGYLAAGFDGEGYFTQSDITHKISGVCRVILGFTQKQNPMYDKMAELLISKGFHVTSKKTGGIGVKALTITRREQIIKFLGTIRPLRLMPKFNPDLLGAMSPFNTCELIEKNFIGDHEVIALSTDAKTYIAEGLASHNCDYDWVLFCSLFGRMIDLPKGFPMYCRDLKQMLDEKSVTAFPQYSDPSAYVKEFASYPEQTNNHNALDDARWNKKLYDFIKTTL
jgi:hypothetical protein